MSIKYFTDIDLGQNDVYAGKYWMYDEPNDNYGSVHLTDGVFHVEDIDGHSMITFEDEFFTFAKSSSIRASLDLSYLTINRDYLFPDQSGILALRSDIPGVSGTTNYVSKFTDTSTLGNSQIFDNGTNVGIGTTSPTFRTQIETTGADVFLSKNTNSSSFNRSYFYNNNNIGVQFLNFGSAYGFGTEFGVGPNGSVIQSNTTSIFAIGTTSAFPLVLGTNGSEKMRITSAGNVGIGTTSPTTRLHTLVGNVEGLRVESSNSGFIEVGRTSGNRWRFSNDYTVSGALELLYGASGAEPTNSRILIDSTGNVGIGLTNPSAKLNVNGTIKIEGNNPLYMGGGGSVIPTWGITPNGNNLEISGIATNTTGNVNFLNLGNVGIGTTSPSEKLDVSGVIKGVLPDPSGLGGITAKLLSYSPSPYGLVFRGYGIGTHSIQAQREANDAEMFPLSLQPNGSNVGIGTTAPDHSALLELKSTTKGFLPPRMRTGERNSIASPTLGLMIFNEDTETIDVFTSLLGWRSLLF